MSHSLRKMQIKTNKLVVTHPLYMPLYSGKKNKDEGMITITYINSNCRGTMQKTIITCEFTGPLSFSSTPKWSSFSLKMKHRIMDLETINHWEIKSFPVSLVPETMHMTYISIWINLSPLAADKYILWKVS